MATIWQIIDSIDWPLVCPVGGEHETAHPDFCLYEVSSAKVRVELHACKKCGAAFVWRRKLDRGTLVVEPEQQADA